MILTVAMRLFRERGYAGVSIDDIGEAAGIAGPSVYRHFRSKEAVLVAGFHRGYEQIVASAHKALASSNDPREALERLIDSYVQRAIQNADIVAVYMTESRALPAELQLSARREQRSYVDQWLDVLGGVRPDLSQPRARVMIHSTIGLINAGGQNPMGLPEQRLRQILSAMASSALENG
jgi:AcrR family transcriptional regulator